jgi:microcystin-dependent protein
LYAVIGTTYGIGDGASTFNIPDFRGLFPVGQKVADANFDALKTPTTYVGEKTHTLTTPEIPAHTHSIVNKDDESGQDDVIVGRATGTQRTYNTGSAGGDGAHNNLPPYIVINFAIKYQ